ncbi:uncharacterized protein F5147DRAFT_762107 [Suillus discolor]|uniref:DUF6533 domain-containing protein n=1 Tax=Suillus discolor TaxID=1912936 RepID=A0A9P7JS86_9AGAM|nr:uncharacterized protein F5147DRAFT_762107 [Suillus discolor]KAG2104356.1 hypothetical protein F5147DRAFT_762107 [Suillus discolor]
MALSYTAQQTIKYLQVAPAAIWILDYFLTFEHEVRLFSNISCWNIVTVMFILARYAPVIWIITQIYPAEGLLLLIVVAMVICDILLALLLENICVPTSTLMVSEFTKMEDLIMGKFVSAALFELIVITLIMYHSIRLRSDGIRSEIGRVTSTLLKGSLLYALSLLVSFTLPASSQEQGGIIVVFQGVLHSVLASRVLFDLRDLRDTGQDEEHDYLFTSYIPSSHSARITNDTNDCLRCRK